MNKSTNNSTTLHFKADPLGATCAMLMLRLWLGIRCLQAGIEKYAGEKLTSKSTEVNGAPDPNGMETVVATKHYGLSYYSGVPDSLSEKFKAEPLINDFFLGIFDQSLGPILLLVGCTVLLGIGTRLSLLAMGLVYTGLTFGLILLNQASGIAWLGTHIILIALALVLAAYNRFEFGNLLASRTALKCLRNK